MTTDGKSKPLATSSFVRMVKLGGLMGRVGASVVSERAGELLRSPQGKEIKRSENLLKNALRVAETLGEMKGAAMKVGQMLSLQEGLLPEEVAEVLRRLQREAPRVPPEVMRYEVEGSLGAPIDELFASFDEDAFAAASIGQVHRATLKSGAEVAVKVQYPLIREVVQADLKNLKTLLGSLFSMVFAADFEPLWGEMRDRLLEELDYRHEAENISTLRDLHAGVAEIVIPRVIAERSSDRVLTMEFIDGVSAQEACSDSYPQEMRDCWGRQLFEFQLRGLLEHRRMHADPNLANFAFLEDGGIVVYDFGCVKKIPLELSRGYARLFLAALEDRREEIPGILGSLGLLRQNGSMVEQELIDPYVDLFAEILRPEPSYVFGEDDDLYDKIMDLGMANWSQATDLRFPEDVIFIDRSLAGHFGNLMRLGASGPWRELVASYSGMAMS